ncbi:unnamed protein product [Macrosiphum euphorbiae]|uniref:Uncharacterized protein n=1 Tax=Macrosiphum euphorbiae TaxID=13131 RepID=A0AAV0XSV8_9HEMI|nr:unnamed protein product [Macrosiphum euphorbiae]
MKQLGPEGIGYEGVVSTQFGLTLEQILFEQRLLVEPIPGQEFPIKDNLTNANGLGKETRKRSLSDILETTTKLNNTEYPITTPINNLFPNVTINSGIITQQTIKENVTKPECNNRI